MRRDHGTTQFWLLSSVIITLTLCIAAPVQAQQETNTRAPIEITVTEELVFGTLIVDKVGRIILDPQSQDRSLKNATALPGDRFELARITITGEPNERIRIDLPRYTRERLAMAVKDFEVFPEAPHFLDPNGKLEVAIGAQATIIRSESRTIKAPFTVEVSYFWDEDSE